MLQPIQDALRRNDNDTAIRLAREALASLPSSPDVLHLLAVGLFQKGQFGEATDTLAQAIALAPDRAGFYVTRGEVALVRGDLDGAYADLSAAVVQDPNNLGAYLGLARIDLARNDLAAAERRLKFAQKIQADNPLVLRLQGQLALAAGQADAAIAAFNEALKRQPNSAELHFEQGMALQRRGLTAVAAQALRNAVRLAPNLLPARRMLVTLLLEGNEIEAGRNELAEVLKRQPQDAGGWGLMGGLQLSLGEFEAGEQSTLRSLAIQPNQPALVQRLVELWARTGGDERARYSLDELLKHHPQSLVLWNARFSLDAVLPAGEEVLARWRAAMPGDLDVEEAAAQRAEALDQLDEAAAVAQAVIDKDPQRIGANLVLARIERDRAPEAAVQRLATLSEQPLPASLRRSVGILHGALLDSLGRCEDAARVWLQSYLPAQGEPPAGLPLPGFLPAGPALAADAPRGADARLLWPLPGTPAVALCKALQPATQILIDRFGPETRRDGLGPLRPNAGHHGEQGADALWRERLAARGRSPEQVIDVLPHVDAALRSAMPDARLLVFIADPRDLLLNWIAFGSLQGYQMPPAEALAEWLDAALDVLAQERASAPDRLHLLSAEALEQDAAGALADALRFYGLEGAPGEYAPTTIGQGPALRLPAGRWRAYAEGPLAEAFARLGARAEAFGYAA
jgi:tetratricopeptide (TPR) repeat protein